MGIQLPAHPKRQREEKKKKRREELEISKFSPNYVVVQLGKMMPKTPRNAPGIEAEPGK